MCLIIHIKSEDFINLFHQALILFSKLISNQRTYGTFCLIYIIFVKYRQTREEPRFARLDAKELEITERFYLVTILLHKCQ